MERVEHAPHLPFSPVERFALRTNRKLARGAARWPRSSAPSPMPPARFVLAPKVLRKNDFHRHDLDSNAFAKTSLRTHRDMAGLSRAVARD